MICLIDPSLQDHSGIPSTNLGDVVIFRAIARCLNLLFPGEEICRISSHVPLEERHYDMLSASRLTFLGGSNMLSSDVLSYNQWHFTAQRSDYDVPRFRDGILLGIGWWQYQGPATPFTSNFYRQVLSPDRLHSVRDRYTAEKLLEAGFTNVVTTACPSMWRLDGVQSDRTVRWTEDCLVMLTDYYTNPPDDEAFIRLVLDHFRGTIFFFPQGTGDIAYLHSLPFFQEHAHKFEILEHSLESVERLLSSRRVTYVGTRLHGGIIALTHRVPCLILGFDNRATEMARSFHLPVVTRSDRAGIERWLRGEALFQSIVVPKTDIFRWCEQFATPPSLGTLLYPLVD